MKYEYVVKKSPLIKYLTLLVLLSCSFQINSEDFFKIDIKPVSIYQEPSTKSAVVTAVYLAEFLNVISLKGKWVKVEFLLDKKQIVGWVEKDKIQVQTLPNDDVKLKNKTTLTLDKTDKSIFFDQQKYKVQVIDNDMHCTRNKKKKVVTGCILDLDIEVNAPAKAKLAEISCKAEFELKIAGTEVKNIWEKKRIRTPLKNKTGATRVQLAILPLHLTKVTSISLQSYQCRLEKII